MRQCTNLIFIKKLYYIFFMEKIRIKGNEIGIIGLKEVFELV